MNHAAMDGFIYINQVSSGKFSVVFSFPIIR